MAKCALRESWKKNWYVKGERGDDIIYHWRAALLAPHRTWLGQSRKHDGVRADSVILPWEELSNMEMEGRHFAMSERADGKQKGENKQTSWETGRRGWLSKDREIGSWKKDAWEQLVIFLQSTANLPSFLAMRVPPGYKMLSVLWDFGNGIGLSTWAIILFGRGHSPPKSYCSPVGFLKK